MDRTRRARRRRRVPVVLGLLLVPGLLALAAGPAVPSVSGAAYDRFYANFEGEEIMRAINADRHALGLPSLGAAPDLSVAARDKAVACPSSSSLTIRGRARDMAERGYLSHDVKGCSDAQGGTFSSLDLLAATGITWSAAGETIASNNYPSTRTSYATGCSLSGGSCSGSIDVPWSVSVVARGWMSSSVHRAIVLSTTYTRFGCGAWNSSAGTHYYSCYFIGGGNASADGTGPSITDLVGSGAVYPVGATPTITASAGDGASLLADGQATLDGTVIRDWAWDHAGSSAGLSATLPALAAGAHHFEWRVRDTSTNSRTASVDFTVGSAGATPGVTTPPSTPTPTTAPTPRSTVSPTPEPTPAATPRRATTGPSPTSVVRQPTAEPLGSVAPAPTPVSASSGPASEPPPQITSSPSRLSSPSASGYSLELGDDPPGPAERASMLIRRPADPGGGLLPALALAALLALGLAAARTRSQPR